jgi:23S rRNA (cytidine1920-2'-O)/16S rRNA (cytidine1409-2'-O)-methyltransferase
MERVTPKPTKIRLDQLLVDRGLADSREKAKALIIAGQVLIDGQKSDKPGHAIPGDAHIELVEKLPYVSRGGVKLAGALDHFKIDVDSLVCLDVGSSTGGFTDCLLQRGAARVVALDVGRGQLDWRLRNDSRVEVREGVNARYLSPADFETKFDFTVCDVSFISATLIVPKIAELLAPHGRMMVLVKPQFEVGRGQVGKGGIVRDPALHQAACDRVAAAVRALGFETEIVESPIRGAEGNREFLLYARML